MTTSKKINISPLEIEIENKITSAYLFSIAAKCGDEFARKKFSAMLQESSTEINQITNNKNNKHGNKSNQVL